MKPLIAVLACICAVIIALACAPDPGPFFNADQVPEDEVGFVNGQLGLITRALNKADELIAFRYLSGLKFGDPHAIHGERTATGTYVSGASLPGTEVWMKVRERVSDPPAPLTIDIYRTSVRQPRTSSTKTVWMMHSEPLLALLMIASNITVRPPHL